MRFLLAFVMYVGTTSLLPSSAAAETWGCLAHVACGSLDIAGISFGEQSKDTASSRAIDRCTAERSKHWLVCLGGSSCSNMGCWEKMETREDLCRYLVYSRERWEYADVCR